MILRLKEAGSKSFTAYWNVMVVVQPTQEVLFYMVVVSIQQEVQHFFW